MRHKRGSNERMKLDGEVKCSFKVNNGKKKLFGVHSKNNVY